MEAYDMFDKMGYSFMVPTNGVTEVVCVCVCVINSKYQTRLAGK